MIKQIRYMPNEKTGSVLVVDTTTGKHVLSRITMAEFQRLNTGVGPIRKTANFTKAAAKHIAAGRPKATEAQVAERFAICDVCEHLVRDKMECGKCGCGITSVVGPVSKLSWADSKCPAGKWHAVQTSR